MLFVVVVSILLIFCLLKYFGVLVRNLLLESLVVVDGKLFDLRKIEMFFLELFSYYRNLVVSFGFLFCLVIV